MTAHAKPGWVLLAALLTLLEACSGEPETKQQPLLVKVCARLLEFPCAQGTQAECESGFAELRCRAAGLGCGVEYDAYLRCIASADFVCMLTPPEICIDTFAAFDNCSRSSGAAPDAGCVDREPQ